MNRFKSFLLIIIFVTSVFIISCATNVKAGSNRVVNNILVASNDKIPIKVAQQQEFIIELESNRTTGYQWQLAEPINESVLALLNKKYIPPKTDLVGAGGAEEWRFRAVDGGKARIYFKYVRPWDKNEPPAQTKIFYVHVE